MVDVPFSHVSFRWGKPPIFGIALQDIQRPVTTWVCSWGGTKIPAPERIYIYVDIYSMKINIYLQVLIYNNHIYDISFSSLHH